MIEVNIRSIANKVKGQGVGSAFEDHVKILRKSEKIKVFVNDKDLHDVLHVHTMDVPSFLEIWKYKRSGKKVSISVHVVPDSLKGSLKLPGFLRKSFGIYLRYFYGSADRCVVVNPYFKKELVKMGIREDKIVFIPNTVATDVFYPRRDKKELRKKLGLPEKVFIVLGAGQIQQRKGIDDFVEAAKVLKDTLFIWLGGFSFGKMMKGYERYKKLLENPPENVIFTGIVERERVALYLNASDVFFLPSHHELLPMSVLEAVNCDLPLILRDLDIYKDVFFENYTKASNVTGFVELIRKFKEDRSFYEQYRQKSRELAEHYSPDRILKMWEDFFHELVRSDQ